MRASALILTVAVAALLTASATAQDKVNPPRKEQIQKSNKKIKELQKERIATLKDMAEMYANLFQNGRGSFDALLEAKVLVFEAQLDAAEKQPDRIALYKNLVDALKQIEELATHRVKIARGTLADVLKAKAKRLEVEIRLERAKGNNPEMGSSKILLTNPMAKDITITQQFVGQIRAQRHINIRSLQKGFLDEIPVKEGQAVKTGEVMFKVGPVLYKAKWDAALADVAIAVLEFRNAETLVKDKVVSQLGLALYKAKLDKAQAKAKLAAAEFEFTTVRAPFDGIIDRLFKQQGSLVSDGDTLTTLSDNSGMWVYFDVSQTRYLEYLATPDKDKAGKVELVLANGSKFKQIGKIGAIEAKFNNDNGFIPFRADFPNPDGQLRHGMTGKVLMHRTLKGAIVIPQRATCEIANKRYVYVVDKDGVAHQRAIVVLHELDGTFVISNGVGVDDRIVLEGIRQVRDGEKVQYEVQPPR